MVLVLFLSPSMLWERKKLSLMFDLQRWSNSAAWLIPDPGEIQSQSYKINVAAFCARQQ